MSAIVISQTGTGYSDIAALDSLQNPFNVSLYASVSGTATFTIQISQDDPVQMAPADMTWPSPVSLIGLTASTLTTLTVPCKAIRLYVSSGSGTVTLEMLQAGVP